jgi:hypothetical protein
MYLPKYNNTSLNFLHEVLADRKVLLKQQDVPELTLLKYPETSIKDLFEMVKDDAHIMKHLPSPDMQARLPEKAFAFRVVNALAPGFI